MTEYRTKFGSLASYSKGGVDIINDDPRNYVFSNMFEVAERAKPWEKVAVAKNMEYVLEVIRGEGTSEWRVCDHDEFALVMDGEVTIELLDPETVAVTPGSSGSVKVEGTPEGKPMGTVNAKRGHLTLLPAKRCYRMITTAPAVILLQTILGPDTVQRWAKICQTY